MGHQPSIVLAFVSMLLLLSIELYEACRSTNLLLPSRQWQPVTPPSTNSVGTVSEQNFAASGLPQRKKSNNNLLLSSLQWRKVTPPSTNLAHNSVSTVSEQNFAAEMPPRKKPNHLLLPSFQWWKVTPPSTNPAHNSVSQFIFNSLCTAMTSRVVNSWLGICTPLVNLKNLHASFQVFNNVSPFIKFVHFTSNQAIIEAFHGCVHIVDLDIMHGLQWPALFHILATRVEDPPPYLKMTGMGISMELLVETGKHLSNFANRLDSSFEFHPVRKKFGEIDDVSVLQIQRGEAYRMLLELTQMAYPYGASCAERVVEKEGAGQEKTELTPKLTPI